MNIKQIKRAKKNKGTKKGPRPRKSRTLREPFLKNRRTLFLLLAELLDDGDNFGRVFLDES
jgi:hypothetical protein